MFLSTTAAVNKPLPITSLSQLPESGSTPLWRLRGWRRWLVGIVALLLVAVIYWQATYVSGIELNSHTWEQRGFSFRRDPLMGIQLTAVRHNAPQQVGWLNTAPNPHAEKLPLAIAKHLSQQSILPQRWDLVRLEDTNLPGAAASILIELLSAYDRGYTPFWPQWSVDNPARAALLWPAAQHLVELEQYPKLPALFDLALLGNSSTQLDTDIRQLVQSVVVEYCQQQHRLGNPQRVRLAAEVGLLYGPHPTLQEFLETSQQGDS